MEREVEGSKSLRIAVDTRRKGREILAMENRICQDTEIITISKQTVNIPACGKMNILGWEGGDAKLNQTIAFLYEMKFEFSWFFW